MSKIPNFLKLALEQMNTHYLWGGKDPSSGLDCSGLVTYSLWRMGVADWRWTHNTDKLWLDLPKVDAPRPGDICLYGNKATNDPSHVMIYLTSDLVFGAAGGDHTTVNTLIAQQQDARVKVKTSINYRSDLMGFRALPLE
jgi:cell wall-associated NlpC family hydrolase